IGSELAPAAGIDAAEEDLAPESVAELGAGGGQSPVRWGMCRERACRGRGRVAPRRSVARIRCVARPSRGWESARRARIVRVAVRRPASGLRSTARKGQDGVDRGHEKAWYTCYVEPPPARTPEMKHVLLPLSEKSKDDRSPRHLDAGQTFDEPRIRGGIRLPPGCNGGLPWDRIELESRWSGRVFFCLCPSPEQAVEGATRGLSTSAPCPPALRVGS